jgi:hypothetical protein
MDIKEKIIRWKELSRLLLSKKKAIYIKEINGDLHFADINKIEEDTINITNFAPEQRKDVTEDIYWINIFDCDEYKLGVDK